MRRTSATLVTAALVALTMLACDPRVPRPPRGEPSPSVAFNIGWAQHCAHEDGPSPDQGYPCAWFCHLDGTPGQPGYRQCGPGADITLYVEGEDCPTVPDNVRCVRRSES
jgi:hypothetical protein